MTRKLKTLALATVVLCLFGVIGASAAQAAPEFHCSVAPCRFTVKPDGAVGTATAHQTFEIAGIGGNFGFTCNQFAGEATTAEKTTKELTVTGITYGPCQTIGFSVAVRMNGCDYLLGSVGTLRITCPKEKSIEIEPGGLLQCLITVGSQGPVGGIKYHDAEPKKKEQITVETNVKGLTGTADAPCFLTPGAVQIEISTGNSILTAETDPGGIMANGWVE